MTGTLINAGAVIAGSVSGLLIRSRLSDKIRATIFQALGLFTLLLGISMALKLNNIILVIGSLVAGSILGELLKLDSRLNILTDFIKKKTFKKDSDFTNALISSFLLFCMGSLTILGALEEGLNNNMDLLLAKSLLDGVASLFLAASLGPGVMFSAIPLLIFQGGITLSSTFLKPLLTDKIIAELSAVGGILLMGLGINILELKKINIVNMLPSIILVLAAAMIFLK